MGRSLRIDPTDGWHHVMNRGVDRQPIFLGDSDRVEFGRLLGVMHEEHAIEIHAYCLMGNHFHLLLHCPSGGLSPAMHRLSSVFARHVNDRTHRDGPLFRSRCTSRLVTDARYIANVVRYIHRNPLDIAGVDDVDNYRWSSQRTYLGHRRQPDWMRVETVLGWFDNDRSKFGAFVRGSRVGARPHIDLPAEDLIQTIEFVVTHMSSSRSGPRRAESRAVALQLADALPGPNQSSLLSALEIATPEAARSARRRARSLLAGRDDLVRMVAAVEDLAA